MGVIASSRYGCTIGAKEKGVKFFFKFFFRGCVGARVWALGCGDGAAGWRLDRDMAGGCCWMER